MPESDTPSEYMILLPAARVSVFAEDENTIEVAQKLAQDWRFARVEITAQKGDVDAAIAHAAAHESPDLVIVQTETIDDAFGSKLEELAGNCDEGTAAVVIGPVNDVYLYRKLIDMGVSDYLVKPMNTDIMGNVMAKALIEKRGVSGSKLISFIGAKGGQGTSALAQAMAWGVSEVSGHKTVLLDCAGGWSGLGVGMGFEPLTTLDEALKAAAKGDEDSIKRVMFRASDKLEVLAQGSDQLFGPAADPDQVEGLLEYFLARTPVVIADLSHSAPVVAKMLISRSNMVVVVAQPVLSSLRLARSLIHEIKDIRGGGLDAVKLVLNMQGYAGADEVPKNDIKQAMEFEPSASIAFLPKVFVKSENDAAALIKTPEGLAVVKTILLPLVQTILAMDGDGSKPSASKVPGGILGGILGRFSKK